MARTRTRTRLVTEQYVVPRPRQLPFPIRLVWFVVIGWWLGGAWLLMTAILAPFLGLIFAPEIGKLWRTGLTLLTLARH